MNNNNSNIVDKRTKGEWTVDTSIPYQTSIHSKWSKENPVETSATFGDYRGSVICSMQWNTGVPTKEQAEANAAFICMAVNNFDSLLEALHLVDNYWDSGNFSRDADLWNKIKETIKKAQQ